MKCAPVREPDENGNRTETKRLMLVEDSDDNRFMLRRLLEINGFEVVEAVNGSEAVKVAALSQPDLILMDLSLPIIDGLVATRQIRQIPELAKVPIIAVSAHDSADFHSQAIAAGCDGFINKPIEFNALEGLITSLLAKASMKGSK